MTSSRAAWTEVLLICQDTLKSHKTVFIILISLKKNNFKAGTLFYT